MQISRLFEIAYVLLNRKTVTAKELAERFEVSARTIYRDIDALAAAGIPVYATRGAGGGIHISDSYVLNKSALSDEEQAQILLALNSLSATGTYRADALLSRLGGLFDKNSAAWIEVDFSRWGNTERDRQSFAVIKDAILRHRVLSFLYFTSYGGSATRTVYPLKLVHKARSWYLQAFCCDKRAFRTFKICRMLDLTVPGEMFDRDTLPAPPHIEWSSDPSVPPVPLVSVLLRFAPQAVWRALDEFDPRKVTWHTDGSVTVRAHLPQDDWLYGYLLSFGTMVDVLAPESLRRALMTETEKILRRYREYDAQLSTSAQYTDGTDNTQGGTTMEMKVCQSCAMPMGDEHYGTNQDGTSNDEYCVYCYKDGAFTSETTLEEMIEICVPHMIGQNGMTEETARKIMQDMLPTLKRWK